MILVNEDNIDTQPIINMLEALNELDTEFVVEYSNETEFPVGVVSFEYRPIKTRMGKDGRFSYLGEFTISIVDKNFPDLQSQVSLFKAKLKSKRDEFSRYNMNHFETQSSPSTVDRNETTYPVRNFTVQYIIE